MGAILNVFAGAPSGFTPVTNDFTTAGASGTVTIPSGATTMIIEVWGSGGGTGLTRQRPGGAGGFVKALIPIKNTDSISLKVGVSGQGSVSKMKTGNWLDGYI